MALESEEHGIDTTTGRFRRSRMHSKGATMTGTAFVLLIIAIVLSTFGEVLLKAGVNRIGTITLAPGTLLRAF
ncbi:MAG: hypothetical protein M3008_06790, partial [Chloroflexota bacterium]|nr:hypothetical protein [Chloroflexota bacterium]